VMYGDAARFISCAVIWSRHISETFRHGIMGRKWKTTESGMTRGVSDFKQVRRIVLQHVPSEIF
jgi:ABC-type arginine transport system permease subunit